MWVPQQLPEIAGPLKKAGLKLNPKQLANLTGDPMAAVVSLGGCTASFVSPQGLVVTNHHCAYGAIQLNSTPEKNLMKDGFNAATLGEEVSAGPERAHLRARHHPGRDRAGAGRDRRRARCAGPHARRWRRSRSSWSPRAKREAGYRCRLYSFSGGNTYRLFRNLEIRDVRLVYAPPGSVGNYGGEVDNWMWPRHTGDFAFYRAYVGKDGKPAAYSPDNVPYQPKHWLKFADKPLGAGDFVMVAGYPGRTARYALAEEFDETASWTYPTIGGHYKNLVALVAGRRQEESRHRGEVRQHRARLAERDEELRRPARRLQAHRRGRQQAGRGNRGARLAAQAGRQGRAGAGRARQAGRAGRGRARQPRARPGVRPAAQHRRARCGDAAVPPVARTRQARCRARAGLPAARPADHRRQHAADGAPLRAGDGSRSCRRYWLREYVKLPASQRVAAVDKWLGGSDEKAIERALDKLAKTKLGSTDAAPEADDGRPRRAREEQGPGDAVRRGDDADACCSWKSEGKARAGDALLARPLYLQAVADYKKSKGQFVYPDANSSLRITFGNVIGYTKTDGSKQVPFTRARGSGGQGHRRRTVRRAASRCSMRSRRRTTAAWPTRSWARCR